MLRWILAILILNGIISFGYAVMRSDDPTNLWAALAVNFTFYLGITQTGIIFSAIMRIAKSEWGRLFSRLGEILTLSFMPVAFATFLILYLGGTENLFYWARMDSSNTHEVHISPWLGKGLFFWRNIIAMTLFYAVSYIYFRGCRTEEETKQIPVGEPTRGTHAEPWVSVGLEKRLNLLAGIVMFFYIAANTNMAWDFGMMIIQHWESTVFPPYYWVGNLFAGIAFLFLIYPLFIPQMRHKVGKEHLDSMGKLLLGFTLLWIYLFWSQYIVIWYSDLPPITGPLFKTMSGVFALPFTLMMIAVFITPFFALIHRRIKLSRPALSMVSLVICAGIWIDRYLMIAPAAAKADTGVFASWTGISLILAGLSLTLASVNIFIKLFPRVKVTTAE